MALRSLLSKLYRPCPLIVVMVLIIIVVLLTRPDKVSVTPGLDPFWRAEHYAQLSIGSAFDDLSIERKSFTYHLNKAAWYGSFISAAQTSPESPALMLIVLEALQKGFAASLKNAGFSEDEQERFRRFSCGVLVNQGNYR
ncbi:dipeptidyl peptidase 3 [Galendromus occidentalis]|uniref:Dipeptidyl peptidase 3 n=1 Tax=Galendromus occidentalis TaxID=34638 RepID=A0AAJ6VXQ1_9ACAR|nr:dipeptidyl peptidase 3 [Galendromus occidentalis]